MSAAALESFTSRDCESSLWEFKLPFTHTHHHLSVRCQSAEDLPACALAVRQPEPSFQLLSEDIASAKQHLIFFENIYTNTNTPTQHIRELLQVSLHSQNSTHSRAPSGRSSILRHAPYIQSMTFCMHNFLHITHSYKTDHK